MLYDINRHWTPLERIKLGRYNFSQLVVTHALGIIKRNPLDDRAFESHDCADTLDLQVESIVESHGKGRIWLVKVT